MSRGRWLLGHLSEKGSPRGVLPTLAAVLALPVSLVANEGGSVVAIGGGARPAAVVERFVALAGGASARILVIPAASADPLDVGTFQSGQLEEHGAGNAEPLLLDREAALDPASSARIDAATGIFLSGGDQRRLADALDGTPALEAIRALHARGGVVGGTSAGAAVLGSLMITGDAVGETLPAESDAPVFRVLRAAVVDTRPGFELIPGVIVDQHFVRRQRQNRLLSLVLEHPRLLGVGIDESTALVVGADGRAQVLGEGPVVIYDAAGARAVGAREDGTLSALDVRLHVLVAGQSFDLGRREPLP